MPDIVRYLGLPKQLSPTERTYLLRLNKIVLLLLALHLPIFVLIAWLNRTDPLQAVILTSLVLVGPIVAYLTLPNPRHVSLVYAFAAMCLGGLLIHYGRGPLQIEMHFYFFTMLAALAMYANPRVIQVATLAIVLHHSVVWWLFPSSVFNYEAGLIVVGVHALFVVIESVAACYLGRSFFDNVIGLERIIDLRTAELDKKNEDMRRLLDSVSDGFVMLNDQGEFAGGYTTILERWLGAPPASKAWKDWLTQCDPTHAEWFELGWTALEDDFMPREVLLDQLPKQLEIGSHTYSVDYADAESSESRSVVVVLRDVTEALAAVELKAEREETAQLISCMMSDRRGFDEFHQEATNIIETLESLSWRNEQECHRLIHTLKGNSRLFGMHVFSHLCHKLEDWMQETAELPTAAELRPVLTRWKALMEQLTNMSLLSTDRRIEIDRSSLESLVDDLQDGRSHSELLATVHRWSLDSVQARLKRMAANAKQLADRLGKDEVDVIISCEDMYLGDSRMPQFWQSLVHVLRNAMDHGMESADEREALGKPRRSTLNLKADLDDGEFVLIIEDDGRGIDEAALRSRAATRFDNVHEVALLDILTASGVSTAKEVTEISGRGVGMGAVVDSTTALEGRLAVTTREGHGTRFEFRLPIEVEVATHQIAA